MIASRNILFFASTLIILSSCNRTDDAQPNLPQTPTQPGQVSFRIDNVNWVGQGNVSGSGVLTAYRGNEILQIQLVSPNPGTYNITASSSPSIRLDQYGGFNYDTYVCSPQGGRIIVTENTGNTISGSFTAKICAGGGGGGQPKEILNGVFNRLTIQ